MLPATPFYMIRHGESTANLGQFASGHVDVPLTEKGLEQARSAALIVAALPIKPTIIIHSHLQRARNTALIINEKLGLEMIEDPNIAEQHYGEWEGVSWEHSRQPIRDGIDPPKGETHAAFHERVRQTVEKYVTSYPEPVLFVCHGGVFRAFGALYNNPITGTENCCLHAFHPHDATPNFPWTVKKHA